MANVLDAADVFYLHERRLVVMDACLTWLCSVLGQVLALVLF